MANSASECNLPEIGNILGAETSSLLSKTFSRSLDPQNWLHFPITDHVTLWILMCGFKLTLSPCLLKTPPVFFWVCQSHIYLYSTLKNNMSWPKVLCSSNDWLPMFKSKIKTIKVCLSLSIVRVEQSYQHLWNLCKGVAYQRNCKNSFLKGPKKKTFEIGLDIIHSNSHREFASI